MTVPELIELVAGSIESARIGAGRPLPQGLADVRGFSPVPQRRLVNLICAHVSTYLEVGLYAGGTFCSSMYGNPHLDVIGVEDRSQTFGVEGVFAELDANVAAWRGEAKSVRVLDGAWEKAAEIAAGTAVDFYYFDGEHGEPSQARALPEYLHALADNFIFMVDDTDWPQVRSGTEKGFAALAGQVKVHKSWRLTEGRPDGPTWHNGIDLFACSKI